MNVDVWRDMAPWNARRCWQICFALLWASICAGAQVPLSIENVSDRATYDQSVWFRVPSSSGYSYRVLLDGQPVPTDLMNMVDAVDYHELSVTRWSVTDGSQTNRLVRFIVQSERGNPEKGLIRWTPYPLITSTAAEFAGANLRLTVPAVYPLELPIPIIAWVEDESGQERRANGLLIAPGFETNPIQVRRGVGSGFLPGASQAGIISYDAELQGLRQAKTIAVEPTTPWTSVSGRLDASTEWPAGSRIFIQNDLTVPAGVTLTINAGSVVKLNPLVNITNQGRLVIEGTLAEPVIFTATNVVWPEQNAGAWGGLLLRGPTAELVANGAVLTGGGGASHFDFSPGSSHRSEQAVLLLHSGARAWLTNCFIINTAGQFGNAYNSDLTLDHCLVQRAITGGEYVGGTITIRHSAFIEFPADNGVVDARIADADYDAIYFTEGTHILSDSLFGFAKDDAIDSGSGGTGTMLVTNCWIESALHEAQAWSGGGRTTSTYDTVALNCGQGIECGYSTGDNTPWCFADRLLSTANAVGARVGDNYDWSYNGFLRLTNSFLLFNHRDVFLKTWNDIGSGYQSLSWEDRLSQIDLQNNWLTTAWTQSGNTLWNPTQDGWRLAHWMTAPPAAPVGIGWAVWTNQFVMADLFAGVPVRLSSFTTNFVSVGYAFLAGGTRLSAGRLTFAPGETLQRVYPIGFSVSAQEGIEVILENPSQGELTGQTTVTFTGSVAAPRISFWVATNNLALARLSEAMLVKLSTPAGQTVTVDYTVSGGSSVLASGTLRFNPGQTVQSIDLTGVSPGSTVNPELHDLLLVRLTHPQNAEFAGPELVVFLPFVSSVSPPLVGTNSPWRYLDTGANLGTDWRDPGFNDTGWSNGVAQLGFGDGDEVTPIGQVGTNGQPVITFYFRKEFVVPTPGAFTNLAMTLLRDDGGVVYLNGTEVYRSPTLPPPPSVITSSTLATALSESNPPADNTTDRTNLSPTFLLTGTNVVAVEIHQHRVDSSDVSFDFSLTGEPVPSASPQRLFYGRFSDLHLLAWEDSTYQLEMTGRITAEQWTRVPGATSPWAIIPGSQQAFFRLRR